MMKNYKDYLVKSGRQFSSIKRSIQHLNRFKRWLAKEELEEEEVSYKEVVKYLEYERRRGIKRVTIKHYLRYVRWYYDYLLAMKKIEDHPMLNLKLNRGYYQSQSVVIHTLLSWEDLGLIYESYCLNPRLNEQSKILLGLLIYQGLWITELPYLKIRNLDLAKAQLNVERSKALEGRQLGLEGKQILGLSKFIENRDPSSKLLQYKNESQSCNSRFHLKEQIKIELKKQGHYKINFMNLRQLRRSVISLWVKQYNLREAQYLAGHKWVNATENYLQTDIEELKVQLQRYHPLQ